MAVRVTWLVQCFRSERLWGWSPMISDFALYIYIYIYIYIYVDPCKKAVFVCCRSPALSKISLPFLLRVRVASSGRANVGSRQSHGPSPDRASCWTRRKRESHRLDNPPTALWHVWTLWPGKKWMIFWSLFWSGRCLREMCLEKKYISASFLVSPFFNSTPWPPHYVRQKRKAWCIDKESWNWPILKTDFHQCQSWTKVTN